MLMMRDYWRLYIVANNSQNELQIGCRHWSTVMLVDYNQLYEDANPQSVIGGLLYSSGRLRNTPNFALTRLSQKYTLQT